MMSSKARHKATRIIDEVFERLDEERLNHLIDEPIERAVNSFKFEVAKPISYQSFVHITSEFVRHVYEHGLNIRQTLSDPQSRAEALAILEDGYQGSHSRGCFAAFLDISDSNIDGVEFISSQMGEIIKTKARERYISWVYSCWIDHADWVTKRMITEILIERWKPFLPSHVLRCPSAQLAGQLSELINILRSTDSFINRMMGS